MRTLAIILVEWRAAEREGDMIAFERLRAEYHDAQEQVVLEITAEETHMSPTDGSYGEPLNPDG